MSSTTPENYHAWFSQQQKSLLRQSYNKDKKSTISNLGILFFQIILIGFRTHIINGKEIEITEISKKMTNHGERFIDSKYLGNVVKWVRSIYQ